MVPFITFAETKRNFLTKFTYAKWLHEKKDVFRTLGNYLLLGQDNDDECIGF